MMGTRLFELSVLDPFGMVMAYWIYCGAASLGRLESCSELA